MDIWRARFLSVQSLTGGGAAGGPIRTLVNVSGSARSAGLLHGLEGSRIREAIGLRLNGGPSGAAGPLVVFCACSRNRTPTLDPAECRTCSVLE